MDQQREQRFTQRLWELQAQSNFSDSELARELGVHVSLINHMKAGRRRLGMKMAMSASERFPELRVLLFSDLPVGTDRVSVGTDQRVAS